MINNTESSKSPLVSVIIPTFNSSKFIVETITSVLGQTLSDIEIIIVDDGSSDDTIELVERISQTDKRIKWFIQKRGGVSIARNRGIKEAHGKYIAFIDHDDIWLSYKLEKQLPLFAKDAKVGLVYSRASIMREDGGTGGLTGGTAKPYRGYVFKELFSKYFIPLSTVIVRREVFDMLDEWFPESMEMAEEVDLFLRIAYGWRADYYDKVLAKWRMHPRNDSKLRRRLMIDDYNSIINRLKLKIPDFAEKYRSDIFKRKRWMAMVEIEILVSEHNGKEALNKMHFFVKEFGLHPKALMKFLILLLFGYKFLEALKIHTMRLVARSKRYEKNRG